MNKLFKYSQHLGGFKVLVGNKDIAPKSITLEKLSHELRELIGVTPANTMLVAVRGDTTYEQVREAYDAEKLIIALDNGVYFNLSAFSNNTFTFSQAAGAGTIKVLTLNESTGWSEATYSGFALGDVSMDIVDVATVIV